MILTEWKTLKEYDSIIGGIVETFMIYNDVNSVSTGRYELDEGCYVNVDDYETRINHLFEAHQAYVDVQLMIDGEEEIYVAPISEGKESQAYNKERDVAFYVCEEGQHSVIRLAEGQAVVLYPSDLHAPCNFRQTRVNRKLVFKIPVELVMNDIF